MGRADGAFTASAALLAVLSEAQVRGAIGPGPLIDHVAHAGAFVAAFESVAGQNGPLLDLGSGGGLPGLVIAERVPGLACTLLDGRSERARSLDAAVERLGWAGRVTVVAERAELAGHRADLRHRFAVVVARSFGPPAVTAECAAAFLRRGGVLVVSEPPGGGERWPADGCAALGLSVREHLALPWSFVLLQAEEPCGERFPRRVGIPRKRPLF